MGDISILGLVAALELGALVVAVLEGVARAPGVQGVVDVAAAVDAAAVDVAVDSKIFCSIISLWRSPNYECFPQRL